MDREEAVVITRRTSGVFGATEKAGRCYVGLPYPSCRVISIRTVAALLCACIATAGCESSVDYVPMVERIDLRPYQSPDTAGEHFEVRNVDGVERIWSKGSGALGSQLLNPVEERRIGAADGDERAELYDITSVTVDGSGRVFTASGEGARVKAFDSSGVFIAQIGREGEGPGEFLSVDHVWVTGDTLVASDHRQQRTTAFRASDGEALRLWSRSDGGVWARPVARGPDGWIAELGQPPRVLTASGVDLPSSVLLHHFDPAFDAGSVGQPVVGTVGARILEIDMPEQHSISGGANVSLPLFAVAPDYGFDTAGRVFVTSDTAYQIDVYDMHGTLTRTITRSSDRVRVTDGTIEELRGLVESLFARDSVLRPFHSFQQRRIDMLSEYPYPVAVPPLGQILVSDDGSFWVERADAPPPGLKAFDTLRERRPLPLSTRWDLFSTRGEFLGTAETPPSFEGMVVNGLEITGLERDEYLIEYVVTYSIDAEQER